MKTNLIQIAVIALLASVVGGFVAGLVGGGNQSVLGSADLSAYGRTAPASGGQWTVVDNIITGELQALASSTLSTFKLGHSGTQMTKVISGTCNAWFDGTSLGATSTGRFGCSSVTGVANGDRVLVQLPGGASSTAANGQNYLGGFVVNGTSATTTDAFGFSMANFTGTASTSFTQATSGVQYWIFR